MAFKSLKSLSVGDIAWDDYTFAWRAVTDVSTLKESIKKVGILVPITVQEKATKKYRVVSGFRRLAAAKQLGFEKIPALELDSSLSALNIFEKLLEENMAIHEFDPVDVSRIIQKYLTEFGLSREKVIETYLPMMGYGKSNHLYELIVPLVNLEPRWHRAIRDDIVPVDLASSMVHEDVSGRSAFLDLIHALKLGKNRQKEFWKMLKDISFIRDMPIAELLCMEEFTDIFKQGKLTFSQKSDRFKKVLWEMRYPRYMEIEDRFIRIVKEAKLPPQIRLQSAPFFEGNSFRLFFSFNSSGDFEFVLTHLKRLLSERVVEQLEKLIK
jgi:hypothetical protein